MFESADLRMTRIPLNHGAGHMPALGFGTLIPDAALTITATRDALEAGFRHFDCAERYGNEHEVGKALQAGLAGGGVAREDIFVTTKLWNSNHRPERVEPAFEASLDRLGLKYLDLYLIHTPFALRLPPFLNVFQPSRRSAFPPSRQHCDQFMKRHCRLAGIHRRKAHFHAFKHSTAMAIWDVSKMPGQIKSYLGHRSMSSTMQYLNESDSLKAQEVVSNLNY